MTDAADSPARPRWRRIVGSLWFQLAAAFVVFGLVLSFVAKPYWVPSASMENTLESGDRIVVSRLAFVGGGPTTGDVVVFDADEAWDAAPPAAVDALRGFARWVGEVTGFGPSGAHTLVKRVVGAPRQVVECCTDAGAVTVDGEPLDEPYVANDLPFSPGTLDCDSEPRSTRCFGPVTVPDDAYLVLGDNRAHSSDSAAFCRLADADDGCWRWATREGIVGRAIAIVWPIGRWAAL